jgi:hypothetical protein
METRRWINQGQPQTLQIAVFLFYFNAVFSVLGFLTGGGPISALIAAGYVGAGYGIANERKPGYYLAVAMAILPFVVQLALGINPLGGDLISLMFEVALVALLVHPQSRDYERIWFK